MVSTVIISFVCVNDVGWSLYVIESIVKTLFKSNIIVEISWFGIKKTVTLPETNKVSGLTFSRNL